MMDEEDKFVFPESVVPARYRDDFVLLLKAYILLQQPFLPLWTAIGAVLLMMVWRLETTSKSKGKS